MNISVQQPELMQFGVGLENRRSKSDELPPAFRTALASNLGGSGFGVHSGDPFRD